MCMKLGLKICKKYVKIKDSSYMEEFWHEDFVFIFLFYLFIFNLGLFWPVRHCLGVFFY
jgi:hypothetical protein